MRTVLTTGVFAVTLALLLAGRAPAQTAETPMNAGDSALQIIKDAKSGVVSDVMAQKLSAEQIVELVKYLQDKRTEERLAETQKGKFQLPGESVLVPIVFFGTVIIIVFIPLFLGYRNKKRQHAMVEKMVENGMTVPAFIFNPPKRRMSDVRRGVILIASGLGIVAGLLLMHNGAWGLGVIPLIIGGGYLAVGKLEKQPSPDAQA
jgi:hypothetical protein